MKTALSFPSNSATPVPSRFQWVGAGDFPDIQPLTVMLKYFPVQQTGYYSTFFHSRSDGTFQYDYFGATPYPQGGASGTVHNWSIPIEGTDDIVDENSNSTIVTKGQWYSQASSARSNGGGQSIVDFYWDLATASTRIISHTTNAGQLDNSPVAPGITFGCAPWSNNENLSGLLRGIQIYSSQLSQADIEALHVCETDAEVLAVCTARSITSLWYLNMNPTPTDITDKSGNGNDPAWVDAVRPGLWTDPEAITNTPVYNNATSGHVYDAGASTYTLAFAAAAGSDRVLDVFVGNGGAASAAAPTGVTWGGQALTLRGSQTNGATTFRQTHWYIKEADFPSGATGNIVATWGSSQVYRGLVAISHEDVNQTTPFRTDAAAMDYNEYTPDISIISSISDAVVGAVLALVDAAGMTGLSVTAGTERTETSIISAAVAQSGATVAGAALATLEWTRVGGDSTSVGMMLAESLVGTEKFQVPTSWSLYYRTLGVT